MGEVETTIDAVRVTTASPERTIVLKQKGAERYLPMWVSQSQADILAAQIQGQPDKSTEPDLFLGNISATDSDIKCVTINLKNGTFYANLQLSKNDEPYEVKCPIGVALTLAYRAGAPILVEETTWEKAALTVNWD